MRFQLGRYREKFQLNQIRNGRPATTFEFNMPNIWKTVSDRYTITIKQNVRFLVGIYCQQCHLDQIHNGQPATIFDFTTRNIHNNN